MKQITKLCTTIALLTLLVLPVQGADTTIPQDTLASLGVTVPQTQALTRGQFSLMAYGLTSDLYLTAPQSPFNDVPSTRADAQAISAVYNLGLLNSIGNGNFAPDRAITMGESVTALLRLLEYTSADIGYRWPEDYIIKAENLGLLQGLTTDSSATLNQDSASTLFYNLLVCPTRNGQTYGENLATTVVRDVVLLSNSASNGGSVDQLSVLSNGSIQYYQKDQDFPYALLNSGRGTLLLDELGHAMGFFLNDQVQEQHNIATVDGLGITTPEGATYAIPSAATLMLGETKTTFGESYFALENYTSALLSYGSSGTVELVLARNNTSFDQYVVTGYYENATPNPYQPTTITVVGHTFQVNPEIASKFAQFAFADKLHLILDEEGNVENVLPYSTDLEEPMIGILDQNSNSVTLLNGITLTGDSTDRCFANPGQLVKVLPSALGKLSISPARLTTQENLDLEKNTLGSYPLADQIRVYECVDDSSATLLSMADITLPSVDHSRIRYYQLNQEGEVDLLLLNNATGDRYTYGIVENCMIVEASAVGELNNYGVIFHTPTGELNPVQTREFLKGEGEVGGILLDEEGEFFSGILLTTTLELTQTAFTGTESLVSDGVRIPLWEDVAVYHTGYDRWISLTIALAECDTFVGYYDKTPEDGGKVRVIYAS